MKSCSIRARLILSKSRNANKIDLILNERSMVFREILENAKIGISKKKKSDKIRTLVG